MKQGLVAVASLVVPLAFAAAVVGSQVAAEPTVESLTEDAGEWTPLFDGNTLDGWSVVVRDDTEPTSLFSFTEEGALRISGETLASLTSDDEYGDYHLTLTYKWGEAPTGGRRNSGLLYHSYGPDTAVGGVWMACVECQMQQGDAGDTYFLGGPTGSVRVNDDGHYDPAAAPRESGGRVQTSEELERDGDWNTLDLIVRGDEAWHAVNGTVVMHLTNLKDGDGQPLTKGKLQLQSEGAELFVKDAKLRRLEGK